MEISSAVAPLYKSETRVLSFSKALLVWFLACTTTGVSLFLAVIEDGSVRMLLGMIPVAVIMAVGCFKAWLILRFYLGLGPQAGSWRAIFIAFLFVIFAGVFAAHGAILLMTR